MIAGAGLQSVLSVGSLLCAKAIFAPTVVLSEAAPTVAGFLLSALAALNLFGVVGLSLAVAWFAWYSEPQKNRRRFTITGAVGLILAEFLPGLIVLVSTGRSHFEPR